MVSPFNEQSARLAPSGPYTYRAFGLVVRSDIYLAELEPDETPAADVEIRIRSDLGRQRPPDQEVRGFAPECDYMYWPNVGGFIVRGEHAIDVEPAEGAPASLLSLPLLGPIMGLLLHRRGRLILHASAVTCAGKSAVFLGASGKGKSTIAATAASMGHRLLADDVLAIDMSSARPCILPGFPNMKLVADAAAGIDASGASILPQPTPEFPKQLRRIAGPFDHTPHDVDGVFVLERGDDARIEPLPTPAGLDAVFKNAYVPMFKTGVWTSDEARVLLRQCAHLVHSTRVARLVTPNTLQRLPEALDLVARTLAHS